MGGGGGCGDEKCLFVVPCATPGGENLWGFTSRIDVVRGNHATCCSVFKEAATGNPDYVHECMYD